MNNEIYRRKGAEDALDWVCSLDDSKGHMLELSMIRNAAHSRSVELFPNENNVSTAQKEYESAFIERALSLVSALFTIDSKTTALHDKRKEFKVFGQFNFLIQLQYFIEPLKHLLRCYDDFILWIVLKTVNWKWL